MLYGDTHGVYVSFFEEDEDEEIVRGKGEVCGTKHSTAQHMLPCIYTRGRAWRGVGQAGLRGRSGGGEVGLLWR